MHVFSWTSVALGVVCFSVFSIEAVFADTSEAIIAQIKKDFDRAEQVKKSGQKIERQGYGADRDGEVTAYRRSLKDDHIVLIENRYALGHHGGVDSFYYSPKGEVYFVFESGHSFGSADDPDSTATERRLYFRDGQLVRCLERSIEARSDHDAKLKKVSQAEPNTTNYVL